MEREPNLVISSASQRIVEDGVPFKVDIYKLEGGDGWSLEFVTEDGTSIVWDALFEDDREAFEECHQHHSQRRRSRFCQRWFKRRPV